jgi:PAS domain S-box-containing protein
VDRPQRPDDVLAELARSGELDAPHARERAGSVFAGPLKGAPDEFLAFDRRGRIVDANERACQQLGISLSDLVGRSVWEVSTRQTRAGFERLVEALTREGPQYLFGHNRRADGSTYPVEARLWLANLDGEPHIFAVLRDTRGYQGLIEERDQLISLIENSAEAIAVATPEGVYTYMNPAGLEMIGLPRIEDVAGKRLSDLHPEGERARIEQEILPALGRSRWLGELHYRHFGTGEETPCWVNAFAIKHSQTGEVIGLAVISHDVSARKVSERQRQKLLELNEVSRNVATSLLEEDDLNRAIGIILSGVGRILSVSRSFLCRYREDRCWVFRTHEWTAAEGERHVVQPEPETAESYAWATEILARGEPIQRQGGSAAGADAREGAGAREVIRALRPDLHALLVMPVLIHGRLESFFCFVDERAPRAWEDQELALLQIIVDSFSRAVERRIAERERSLIARDLERAVARERAANRYKSEFLANMSHELRTPMNAIVGYAELLSRPNVDRKKQELWIAHIRKSTSYLLSLINDVLDLSKIEAGQMTVDLRKQDVATMIGAVEELLRGQAEEKLLEFRVLWEGLVPQVVETDPVRFKQILVNLVGNAIKFTSEGHVHVRVRTEGVDSGVPPRLAIAVEDTGIGIGVEDLKRLFRPFAQLHAGRDPRFGGTGLGLDISRHLARLLGSEIDVVSEVGKGSTFTLRHPLSQQEAEHLTSIGSGAAARAATPRAVSLAGRSVLVVDDSPENREVLRFLLEESGCQIETAENGAQGVARARQAWREKKPFDVILMDVNMPVLDGYEATRQIVAAGVRTPVIALTALALAGDKDRCLAAGCVDYVSKPVVPSSFFETIGRHLAPEAGRESVPASTAPVVSLVGNPRFQPLIERYVGSFPDLRRELGALLGTGRMEELRTRVHRLRGTASNYGFPEVSRAAGACEDTIRAGGAPTEIAAALAELDRLLASAAAPRGA